MKFLKKYSVFLCLALIIISCGTTEEDNKPQSDNPGTMNVFVNEIELENYIKEHFASAVVETSFDMARAEADDTAEPGDSGDGQGNSDGSQQYSDTNVQESGVDESDKIKTDGNILYVAQDQKVKIIKLATDKGMSLVAEVAIGENIDSLYLYKSVLVVIYRPFGDENNYWCGATSGPLSAVSLSMPCRYDQNRTGVLIIDVHDPSRPERIRNLVFDGSLVSSRRINGMLHLISRYIPALSYLEYYYDKTQDAMSDVVKRNLAALEDIPLNELLPSFELLDNDGNIIDSGLLVPSEDFMRPGNPQGAKVVSIVSLDLDNPHDNHDAVGAVLDARHVYSSTTSLYLATETWNYNISDENSISAVQTSIHKFDLSGDNVSFSGSGRVPGSILNQFSFGEYKNVLRVATSTWNWSSDTRGVTNSVYCLSEIDKRLTITGRLEDLAPGEHLYAARFMGDRGFLVTFVKVDPLFTLDLSDPANPELIGELKVPGYSDYIHPLEDNHLLTIGKDAIPYESWSYYQGLQLSIFDVSDFESPVLIHQEKIGDRGSESEALHIHKAFTYWTDKDLLAIPVDLYEHKAEPQAPWDRGTHMFSGLYVYKVTSNDGFSFLGRISTSNITSQYDRYHSWTRGLFVEDNVYAITSDSVQSADIDDMENTVALLRIN